jgi:hypothetical protein
MSFVGVLKRKLILRKDNTMKSHVGMINCWICGEGSTILLDRKLRSTLEHNMGSLPTEICSQCKTLAEDNDGIWLISIRDGEEPPIETMKSEIWNPYRTGGLILFKKEALKRFFSESLEKPQQYLDMVDKHLYFYLNDSVWDHVGLPRGEEINNLEEKSD